MVVIFDLLNLIVNILNRINKIGFNETHFIIKHIDYGLFLH